MLLLDGQVHHDTHAVPMGNYVIGVGNYVIATPSELGNYMSADTMRPVGHAAQSAQSRNLHWPGTRHADYESGAGIPADPGREVSAGPQRPEEGPQLTGDLLGFLVRHEVPAAMWRVPVA